MNILQYYIATLISFLSAVAYLVLIFKVHEKSEDWTTKRMKLLICYLLMTSSFLYSISSFVYTLVVTPKNLYIGRNDPADETLVYPLLITAICNFVASMTALTGCLLFVR